MIASNDYTDFLKERLTLVIDDDDVGGNPLGTQGTGPPFLALTPEGAAHWVPGVVTLRRVAVPVGATDTGVGIQGTGVYNDDKFLFYKTNFLT